MVFAVVLGAIKMATNSRTLNLPAPHPTNATTLETKMLSALPPKGSFQTIIWSLRRCSSQSVVAAVAVVVDSVALTLL